ncbi:hypothetical protein SARC_04132 [Sphaeroforma arctica JP610]|uniref:Deacetylase sirtuin-type domain-containing protein n=1 Tax=Sphaeroforma arctica JP610 TaxID=667725 RepID=A0A0L0G5Z3_9EUKA|nr:hypothetical protein SARC_04132 [Sphaeroforma arctica JP610]KNC83633.1 hypothetical protein SARC_04132 [Sphaeroforma arctica JP610]|eukprot:XP_014157535.1 hypothetical protein SARC_04132 [Sphaeroforma arctica JP610]
MMPGNNMTKAKVDAIAASILSGRIRNIMILSGAGVSTASGIPDFRSVGGMYDTLKPNLLTATEEQRQAMRIDPIHVVSLDLFRETQLPYLELRRPFILGLGGNQWRPTLMHFLSDVLHKKGLLTRVYTQNIDGLDFKTSVPPKKIIPVHGSLMVIKCESCKTEMDSAKFRELTRTHIKDIYNSGDDLAPKKSSPIPCPSCGKPYMKPDTVLYGSSLPREFFMHWELDAQSSDLLIIAGTSLTVGPANRLPGLIRNSVPRLVLNNEEVGMGLGLNYAPNSTDTLLKGSCDSGCIALLQALGWLENMAVYESELCDESAKLLRSHLNAEVR